MRNQHPRPEPTHGDSTMSVRQAQEQRKGPDSLPGIQPCFFPTLKYSEAHDSHLKRKDFRAASSSMRNSTDTSQESSLPYLPAIDNVSSLLQGVPL